MRVLRSRRTLLRAALELELELELLFVVVAAAAGRGASAGADAPELFLSLALAFPAGPGRRGGVLCPGMQEALPSAQQQ